MIVPSRAQHLIENALEIVRRIESDAYFPTYAVRTFDPHIGLKVAPKSVGNALNLGRMRDRVGLAL